MLAIKDGIWPTRLQYQYKLFQLLSTEDAEVPNKMATFSAVLAGIQLIDEFMADAKGKLSFGFNVEDIKSETIPVHCDLAASYGELSSQSIKAIDDELKIMIAGSVRALNKLADKSWESVVACMMQNTLIEPVPDGEVTNADKLIKEDAAYFKFDGSPDQKVINEVHSWFTKLISDQDVLDNSKIDIDLLAKIVAQSGATIDSFATLFYKHEYHERTMLEIGVIRFPDLDNPHFKLYRIKLTAWSDCSRVLFGESNSNGITGVYNCKKFRPRASVISELKKSTKVQAVSEAEDLFG